MYSLQYDMSNHNQSEYRWETRKFTFESVHVIYYKNEFDSTHIVIKYKTLSPIWGSIV